MFDPWDHHGACFGVWLAGCSLWDTLRGFFICCAPFNAVKCWSLCFGWSIAECRGCFWVSGRIREVVMMGWCSSGVCSSSGGKVLGHGAVQEMSAAHQEDTAPQRLHHCYGGTGSEAGTGSWRQAAPRCVREGKSEKARERMRRH